MIEKYCDILNDGNIVKCSWDSGSIAIKNILIVQNVLKNLIIMVTKIFILAEKIIKVQETIPNSIKDYFTKNKVKLIKLDSDKWIIEYKDNQITTLTNIPELESSKSFFQQQTNQLVRYEQLKESKTEPSKSYLLWILGGIGIVGVIMGLVYFLTRKKKNKE